MLGPAKVAWALPLVQMLYPAEGQGLAAVVPMLNVPLVKLIGALP